MYVRGQIITSKVSSDQISTQGSKDRSRNLVRVCASRRLLRLMNIVLESDVTNFVYRKGVFILHSLDDRGCIFKIVEFINVELFRKQIGVPKKLSWDARTVMRSSLEDSVFQLNT